MATEQILYDIDEQVIIDHIQANDLQTGKTMLQMSHWKTISLTIIHRAILPRIYKYHQMKQLIIAILFLLPAMAMAQKADDRKNEIESYKIAYLTQKLDLSSEEAKVFWPIYNAWQKEQTALRKERGQKMISFRKIAEIEELSDTEVQNLIVNDFSFKQRELNLEKKYYSQLKSNLPIKIVGKFYRAQEAFKRELLSKYRNNGWPQRN